MGRKILLITTDQMRYDALGCTGGKVARTPRLDALAQSGINFTRAHNQSVVCMPARATIVTGQYPATHGVWMNGVALPEDAPSVAHVLGTAGYKTALIGKAHFEPWMAPPGFYENEMARRGETGPHRGFDRMELANHFMTGNFHYDQWMQKEHKDQIGGFYPIVSETGQQNHIGGADTGAIQCWVNDMPRELYHTDWVADRVIAFLDSLDTEEDWFIWMSFPDPHHPWDPPASELGRVDWRDLDLPELYAGSHEERAELLERKPRHWKGAWDGSLRTNFEFPPNFRPCDLTDDQVREINAMNHIENELIDEACGRVFDHISARGWDGDTDIFFTTDHGEMQGDFGLMFKGAFHVDALMRLPFLWRPAPDHDTGPEAGTPRTVPNPVGHVDLAPTFCALAGLDVPEWMEGAPLPASAAEADGQARETVLTGWDSVHRNSGDRDKAEHTLALRTISTRTHVLTAYRPGSIYDGTEGELYDLEDDPLQRINRWDDPACAAIRKELMTALLDEWPQEPDERLPRIGPA
ncbi:sulfatase family protein [Pyruvatibacter mobilis]|uniref:sulfatase family protein n=1 Tax=Pyruvatibacter mobilis TaxID=1712261 RepID=UPI003C7B7578